MPAMDYNAPATPVEIVRVPGREYHDHYEIAGRRVAPGLVNTIWDAEARELRYFAWPDARSGARYDSPPLWRLRQSAAPAARFVVLCALSRELNAWEREARSPWRGLCGGKDHEGFSLLDNTYVHYATYDGEGPR